MSSSNGKIIALIKGYAKLVRAITASAFDPLEKFFAPYSKSVSESFNILQEVTANFLILSPVFIVSIITGTAVFGFNSNPSQVTEINIITLTATMLMFSSIFVFSIARIKDKNLTQSVYISLLLVAGGGSIIYFNPPEVYAVLFGVFYGIGGYISSYISFDNPLPHKHIYETLEPHKRISRLSIFLIITLTILYGVGFYIKSQGFNQTIIAIVGGLLPAFAFIITTLQYSSYKQVYKHVGMSAKSPIWVLTPRLLIILGIGLSLSNMEIGLIEFTLFASPAIFGLVFSYYIVGQTKDILGQTTFSEAGVYADPVKITGNEHADVDTHFDEIEETAGINASLSIEITEDIPSNKSDPWIESAVASKHLLESLKIMKRVDEEKIEELRQFKNNTLRVGLEKHTNSRINWNEIPESLRSDIIRMKTSNGELDLQDIADLELKFDDDMKKKVGKDYADPIK